MDREEKEVPDHVKINIDGEQCKSNGHTYDSIKQNNDDDINIKDKSALLCPADPPCGLSLHEKTDFDDNNIKKEFFKALEKEHLDCFIHIANKHNVDINTCNKNGDTALHISATKGYLNIVDYLLSNYKIDINQTNKSGKAALHLACENGKSDIVEGLITRENINCEKRDKKQNTPLHIACESGKAKCCEILANCSQNSVNKVGNTPLICAALNGNHECIEYLDKSNVNVQNKDGETALHLAAKRGYHQTIKHLLPETVDLLLVNRNGNTAIMEAAKLKESKTLQILIEFIKYDTFKELLCIKNKKDQTLLHIATENNSNACFTFILQHFEADIKSSINIKDKNEETLLHIAMKQKHIDNIYKLLNLGASIEEKNKDGKCSLHIACEKGLFKVMRECIFKDSSSISMVDNKNWTPLHYATSAGSKECCEYLLKRGADITAKSATKETPLHIAVNCKSKDLVYFLFKENKSKMSTDQYGNTPLHVAAENGKTEYCRILTKTTEKRWLFDKNTAGKSPLNLAFDNNHAGAFEVILQPNKEYNDSYINEIHSYMHKALASNDKE